MINRRVWDVAVRAMIVAAAGFAPAANAQQVVIDRCKETSSDADRIACLEAALLGTEPSQLQTTKTQDDPPSIEVNAKLTAAETATEPAIEAAPKPDAKPVGIGADQVIARTQTREDILESLEEAKDLVVASYDVVPYKRMLVTLKNGQVWRQIKGDTQKIRVDLRRNQTVDITESSISGYKLRLNEMRRTIRVERVK